MLTLAACTVAALASAGNGSGSPGERTVRISERDFRIKAPARLAAGNVRLEVTNRGPVAHELIVVRSEGQRCRSAATA